MDPKTTQKEKPDKSILEKWIALGLPCYYVRFQGPVARHANDEPVSEFRITGERDKYIVDSIWYTPHGIIWKSRMETNITPLANAQWSRIIL